MKVKVIAGIFLLLFVVTGCSSIIYAIRGPKYKGKFDITTYPKELDSTSYYYTVHDYGDKYFDYRKFNNNGTYYGYTSVGKPMSIEELDTIPPFQNYFVFKNGYLRWEIYHDSYNGYNLFKAEVYKDSIVAWQIGFAGSGKASKKTYYKMK